MNPKSLFLIPAIAALAACGGSGTGNLSNSDLPGPPAFNALITGIETDADQLDMVDLTITFPEVSDATYAGAMIVADIEGDIFGMDFTIPDSGYVGAFAATADFTAGTVDGDATGFFFYDESGPAGPATEVAGVISVSTSTGPQSTDTGPVFFAVNYTGNLEIDGTVETITSGSGEAAFAGPDAAIFVSVGEATFTNVGTALDVIVIGD